MSVGDLAGFVKPETIRPNGKRPDRIGGIRPGRHFKMCFCIRRANSQQQNLVDKSCETFKGNAKARIRALALYRLVDLANDLDLLAWMGEPAIWCRLCTAVH